MIRIVEENSSQDKQQKFSAYLDEQDYTYDDMIEYVINKITDSDDYFGISLAYDSDYSDRYSIAEVNTFAKSIIDDYFVDEVISLGPDYEYDYTEVLDDLLNGDAASDIEDFNRNYEHLEDKQQKDWQDEIDYLNRSYERDAMPPGTFRW